MDPIGRVMVLPVVVSWMTCGATGFVTEAVTSVSAAGGVATWIVAGKALCHTNATLGWKWVAGSNKHEGRGRYVKLGTHPRNRPGPRAGPVVYSIKGPVL